MRLFPVIAILDDDFAHAQKLYEALESSTCRISIFSERVDVVNVAKAESINLIIFVSHSRSHWRGELKSLCAAIAHVHPRPSVLSVLRWPLGGPDDRIYGDELNVSVIHE